jgi:Protein of unknown function (DUF4244)
MGKDISAVGDLVIPIDGSEGPLEQVAENEAELAVRPGSALAHRSQRGMVSAEWAVGIVAAVAIAGVLLAVITGGQVQDALLKFILWVIKGFVDVVS